MADAVNITYIYIHMKCLSVNGTHEGSWIDVVNMLWIVWTKIQIMLYEKIHFQGSGETGEP